MFLSLVFVYPMAKHGLLWPVSFLLFFLLFLLPHLTLNTRKCVLSRCQHCQQFPIQFVETIHTAHSPLGQCLSEEEKEKLKSHLKTNFSAVRNKGKERKLSNGYILSYFSNTAVTNLSLCLWKSGPGSCRHSS